jgi:hypothetical protein
MKTPQHFPIALNLPKVVALLVVFGRHIVQCMTNNPWFSNPGPQPALPTVTGALDDLEAAEVAVKNRTKGSAAVRDGKKAIVIGHLMALKGFVALIASQNAENALAVIESAGLSGKRTGKHAKPPLAAALGPGLGNVLARARAAGRRVAYEWQVSSDGGTTWTTFAITTVASATLTGVTAGTTYLFRLRSTVKTTTSDWSQVVSLTVH